MPQHAIVAFPESDATQIIEDLRSRYDPQVGLIRAHITLVFPFSDDVLAAELNAIVRETVGDMSPIELHLDTVTEADDGYIFLGVGFGRDMLVALHDSLYRGRLSKYLSRKHVYIPHVTIGRLANGQARHAAAAQAREAIHPAHAVVRSLSVFRLESPSKGQIVSSVDFHRRADVSPGA